MNIFNANLEVTKATVQGGEIKELEINRQNVPLASSIAIETSKAVTIDASTYSSPVEVTPTAGKDGMKKVTVSLSNIPSGGDNVFNLTATMTMNNDNVIAVRFPPTEQEVKIGVGSDSPITIPSNSTASGLWCDEFSYNLGDTITLYYGADRYTCVVSEYTNYELTKSSS